MEILRTPEAKKAIKKHEKRMSIWYKDKCPNCKSNRVGWRTTGIFKRHDSEYFCLNCGEIEKQYCGL